MALVRPLALALAFVPALAVAQRPAAPPAPAARATLAATDTARGTSRLFKALRWRNVGPFRGGRVGAVAGDLHDRRVFYFGAVNGGVWKTANGGQSWTNISDGRVTGSAPEISSVGAIAVAPSDANVLYVGTGEKDLREDLTYGTGVYRSTDGGDTWTHLGLGDTQQIGALRVHPTNPDIVYVAAMGHAFGPNAERGVFRTTDGGKSWKKVLFLDDSTGAIDLAMDPSNPRILYAAMWKFQRFPWGMHSGGGKSGLWKSTDGGDTWTDLSASPGLPDTPFGRIGIAVSPANPKRVWLSLEAPDSAGETRGGIFRSDDAGKTWTRTSGDQRWQVRAWYYSAITADPVDPNTVYVLNLGTWRSTDGGKTWQRIQVPHGDCHILWIDPKDPERMIHGNDGGATVSYDAGATWSSIYNQPTAQFYHVTTDTQWPYRIYGAQQDNTTVSIASRSDAGAITRQDWFPVAGCENAYIAVDPRDANITYGGCYMGSLTRYDRRTNQARDVSVGLANYDGWAARDVPNRFAWTYPIFLSPHDPSTLYISSQFVYRSTNEGQSWTKISPDLSLNDPATTGPSGGSVHYDMTGTEWYAMVFALAESPREKGLLWAGSDDGLVHVSRDGGQTWTNVTPKGLGKYTKISIIEPGHFDAGTAYIAANRYQQDDFRPYLFKTTDYGKNWTPITSGIPVGAYTRAIREDPVRRGLLFAGTETGVYVSFDDGARWESLQLNLPRSSVRDLHIHENDLIAATHGRAFWVLDDIALLRQLGDSVRSARAHLFAPSPAYRFADGGSRREGDVGENPPNGVIVDYFLREKPSGKVTLEFLDAKGSVIRTFSSESTHAAPTVAAAGADTAKRLTAADSAAARRARADSLAAPTTRRRIEHGDSLAYTPSDSIVQTRPGTNRFVWNLRYADAKKVEDIVIDDGTLTGPAVVPGRYTVRLTVDGRAYTQPFTVVQDPRLETTQADLEALLALSRQVIDRISQVSEEVTRIEDAQRQLDARVKETAAQPYAERVASSAKAVRTKLEAVRTELVEVHSRADQITLHYPIKLYNMLISLNAQVQSADARPTDAHHAVYAELSAKVAAEVQRLRALETGELAAFNKLMKDLDVPAVSLPAKGGGIAM